MRLFSEIERTIERGFRKWTGRVFGAAQSDELLLVHRAILEEIETKVQTASRGQRIFPYSLVTVTLISSDPDRRALYVAAFGAEARLENDVRQALEGAGCQLPRGFAVEVKTAESGDRAFEIAYGSATPAQNDSPAPASLVVVKGTAEAATYAISKPRTNIGRLAELTDAEQRVVRRNEVVFLEGGDDANGTVSRKHAHIQFAGGQYRIADDGSEFGTRVFRDGRSIDVPAGNRRGEKLRSGDEIYLGRACLRFQQ
ncbi:MAG: FHA domain-containing protein [Bryobacteraceae bacterium]